MITTSIIEIITSMEKAITADMDDLYDVLFCSDHTYTPDEAQVYLDAVSRITTHAAFCGATTSPIPTTASISEVVADQVALLRKCADEVEETHGALCDDKS